MIQFPKKIDRELVTDEEGKWLAAKRDLEEAIKSLPGIKISCSSDSIGPLKPYMIFLRATNKKGLAFLTRCIDHRYWKYGHIWKLELIISDTLYHGDVITYWLHSGKSTGKEAYEQAVDLVENMEYHLNHENFMVF